MGLDQCSREKYWKELTVGEKVERMREVIKAISNDMQATKRILYKMEKHSHQDNKLVIPFKDDRCGGTIGHRLGQKPDEVYF